MSDTQSGAPSLVESPASADGSAIESSESTENILEDIEGTEEGDEISADEVQAEQKAKEQAVQNLKKKLKLKVDGEEFEEEIDFGNEEDLKKRLQKARAFDKRSQELSSFKGQVDEFLKQLQADPEAILEKLGLNVDEMSEKRLRRKVEELEKSPEQLEREKMQKELETLRQEKERIQKEREAAEMERMRNETAKQIEDDILGALEDTKSILPKQNPEIIHRIARAMYFAMQNGFPQVTAKDVVPVVEKQYREELGNLFGAVPEDILEDLIGKPNLDRLRKKRISAQRVKTQTAKQIVKDSGIRAEEEKPKERKRIKDFFRAD